MDTENPVNVDTVGLWVDPADLPLILSCVQDPLDNVEPEHLGIGTYDALHRLAAQIGDCKRNYDRAMQQPQWATQKAVAQWSELMGAVCLWINSDDLPVLLSCLIVDDPVEQAADDESTKRVFKQVHFQLLAKTFLERKGKR
jgi:hypothetical protein